MGGERGDALVKNACSFLLALLCILSAWIWLVLWPSCKELGVRFFAVCEDVERRIIRRIPGVGPLDPYALSSAEA